MGNKSSLTKTAALLGVILVWLPLIAPVVFCIISLIRSGRFRFDYLMPAELLPVALVGAGLLIWAAFRSQRYAKLISWAMGAALFLLIGGQTLAVVAGFASGAREPTGWLFSLVLSMIIAFDLGLVVVGVGGLLLVRTLFNTPQ